jgi:predicted MFS family arabinose efflux permease
LLGFALGGVATGALFEGALGFATPPVFGVTPPVFGVVWARAKVPDRRTRAIVVQRRCMV